jgi:hypothetical protein
LLISSASNHVMTSLIVPSRDLDHRVAFAGVSVLEDIPLALCVPASLPAQDLQGLVSLLRREAEQAGIGGSQHLADHLFR